jgi:hypothetical protein
MTNSDIVFALVVIVGLAVLYLSPSPSPMLSSRVQWGILFFLVFLALAATRWISN